MLPELKVRLRLVKISPIVYIFLFPIPNQEITEKHTAQVGKMRHGITTVVSDTHKQFGQSVKDHEIFCLDRNRDEHQVQRNIREQHGKCQQNTEHGTRSTDRNQIVQ